MRQIPPAALPNNPFYGTPQQRLALARQRYFEDGVRPSGLVSEAVIQSWQRCLQARHDPTRVPGFNPVTPSRIHGVMARSRELLQAATKELDQLRATLAGTTGTAILTDAHGVVVGTTFCDARPQEVMLKLSARVGVNLAEEAVGTTAPGITARTGQASVVLGCEHFFNPVQVMYCAAAPIHDVHGRLAGVLDLSSELVPFQFDAASVVGLYATAIENRLLCAQSSDHLVLRMQVSPALLETPMAGLVGIASSGRIAWLNGTAARLLGVAAPQRGAPGLECEQVLGHDCTRLAALTQAADASPMQLPNGLMVWVRARLQAHDGAPQVHAVAATPRPEPALAPAAACAPAAPMPAGTLRELDRHLVARTLEGCGGNVSKAARQLGVSRGLIYRHLKRAA
jgi:transcriptional regulator of acetoin/glycerol metabolism